MIGYKYKLVLLNLAPQFCSQIITKKKKTIIYVSHHSPTN